MMVQTVGSREVQSPPELVGIRQKKKMPQGAPSKRGPLRRDNQGPAAAKRKKAARALASLARRQVFPGPA